MLLVALLLATPHLHAQQIPVIRSNYQLAARFSPKKLEKMIFSTQVDAHWLKKSDRFWYMFETTEGKKWYIVDPSKTEKKPLFDNDKLAAAISRIVKDPFELETSWIGQPQIYKGRELDPVRSEEHTGCGEKRHRKEKTLHAGQTLHSRKESLLLRIQPDRRDAQRAQRLQKNQTQTQLGQHLPRQQHHRIRPPFQPVLDGSRQLRKGADQRGRQHYRGPCPDDRRHRELQLSW